MNVLLVDDDPLRLLGSQEQAAPLQDVVARTATSFEEARNFLIDNQPDLIITDYFLGEGLAHPTGGDLAMLALQSGVAHVVVISNEIDPTRVPRGSWCTPNWDVGAICMRASENALEQLESLQPGEGQPADFIP